MIQPYASNLKHAAKENENFREVLFTGAHSQLVIMSIEPGDDIGLETHDNVDQILYAVDGEGSAILAGERFEFEKGDVVCVPAGTEHDIVNDGDEPLRLFTVYSPPQHAPGTIEHLKLAEPTPVARS